jgi:hypothetical protein
MGGAAGQEPPQRLGVGQAHRGHLDRYGPAGRDVDQLRLGAGRTGETGQAPDALVRPGLEASARPERDFTQHRQIVAEGVPPLRPVIAHQGRADLVGDESSRHAEPPGEVEQQRPPDLIDATDPLGRQDFWIHAADGVIGDANLGHHQDLVPGPVGVARPGQEALVEADHLAGVAPGAGAALPAAEHPAAPGRSSPGFGEQEAHRSTLVELADQFFLGSLQGDLARLGEPGQEPGVGQSEGEVPQDDGATQGIGDLLSPIVDDVDRIIAVPRTI